MRTRHLAAAALAVAVLAAACGGTAGPQAPPIDTDGGGGEVTATPAGAWVLVEADPPIEVPDDARVTMQVTAEGDVWEVGGTSACNSYFGTVDITDGSWQGQGFGGTDMGCDEPRMAAERAYLDALTAITAWARASSDELVLTGPATTLRFEELPPVPTAALVGTTWTLDGLVSGAGPDGSVSSTAADADEATLRLEADGAVEASTGCRTFTGEWIETGDEIVLPTFGQRDDSPNVATDGTTTCDEAVVAQEDHVLSVLGDGFRAEVDGQRLILTSRDGLGLTYRATDDR